MSITFDAIFENGVLRPTEPVTLQEHVKVRVTIEPDTSRAERSAGMVPWTGDATELEQFAIDPAFAAS